MFYIILFFYFHFIDYTSKCDRKKQKIFYIISVYKKDFLFCDIQKIKNKKYFVENLVIFIIIITCYIIALY